MNVKLTDHNASLKHSCEESVDFLSRGAGNPIYNFAILNFGTELQLSLLLENNDLRWPSNLETT